VYKWIKHIVESYEKMFTIEVPKRPTIYKIGDKRYVLTKRISDQETELREVTSNWKLSPIPFVEF
jgi:hypothetical protein